MKIEDTFIDKNGIRRFYHQTYKINKLRKAGERAYEIVCSECGGVGFIRKHSIGRKSNHCTKECQRAFMFREKDGHLNWKGGKHTGGTYNATMVKGHSRADRDGYVPDHLLVMEQKIGRPVRKDEIVHHIDMNKKNNDISNLYITNRSEHIKIHHQMQLLIVDLMKIGLVKFIHGKYTYIDAE